MKFLSRIRFVLNFYETEIREKREKKKKREPCNDMAGADRSDGGLEWWQ
jgi:hypothetical protein